jgi:hypothetical protein
LLIHNLILLCIHLYPLKCFQVSNLYKYNCDHANKLMLDILEQHRILLVIQGIFLFFEDICTFILLLKTSSQKILYLLIEKHIINW